MSTKLYIHGKTTVSGFLLYVEERLYKQWISTNWRDTYIFPMAVSRKVFCGLQNILNKLLKGWEWGVWILFSAVPGKKIAVDEVLEILDEV